jgi:ketosteroid isomerase-like protein
MVPDQEEREGESPASPPCGKFMQNWTLGAARRGRRDGCNGKAGVICLAAILMCAGSALADPAAVVKAHSDAFGKSFNSCDVPAALNLYEDNAVLIWPGEGEVAHGKAAIAKVIKAECSGTAKSSLKQISSDSRAIGKDYIINVGMWDDTMTGADGKQMTARVRTTELLHRSNGKWRYVIDNASIGLPPPPGKP